MEEVKKYQYFVNNEWHEPVSGKFFESENPANGKVWARLANCGSEEVNKAVAAAKQAFYQGPWGKMMPSERGRYLRTIGDVISKNAERLGRVETRDNGKLPKQITPSLEKNAWSVDSWSYGLHPSMYPIAHVTTWYRELRTTTIHANLCHPVR